MILKDDTVLLRDFKREDIAKRIEWETEKTEWQLWDGPWEYEGLTEEQKKENLQKYIKALEEWAAICESLSDEMPRKSFQICTPEGEYVGWCGSYFINEDCCIDENGDRPLALTCRRRAPAARAWRPTRCGCLWRICARWDLPSCIPRPGAATSA